MKAKIQTSALGIGMVALVAALTFPSVQNASAAPLCGTGVEQVDCYTIASIFGSPIGWDSVQLIAQIIMQQTGRVPTDNQVIQTLIGLGYSVNGQQSQIVLNGISSYINVPNSASLEVAYITIITRSLEYSHSSDQALLDKWYDGGPIIHGSLTSTTIDYTGIAQLFGPPIGWDSVQWAQNEILNRTGLWPTQQQVISGLLDLGYAENGRIGGRSYASGIDANFKADMCVGVAGGINLCAHSEEAAALNTWEDIAREYNGTSISVNLDETWQPLKYDVSLPSGDNPLASNEQDLHIGAIQMSPTSPLISHFNGSLESVIIYDRALAQSEVTYDFDHPNTPIKSGMVLWFSFKEGTGNTLYDLSPNGNNGGIVNATWKAP